MSKKDTFVAAVKDEKFGKCPKPSQRWDNMYHNANLVHCIRRYCYVDAARGYVSVNVKDMSKAEVEYCLMVARRLGYTPKW